MDNQQGSIQWLIDRLGKITGTGFQLCLGSHKARVKYAHTLSQELEVLERGMDAAEAYVIENSFDAPPLKWGRDNEPAAIATYEFRKDVDVQSHGLIVHHDYDFIGVSLDGSVGHKKIIEVKCPYNSKNHMAAFVAGMDSRYTAQTQGNQWVFGADVCDFISFDPRQQGDLKLIVIPQPRNDGYISRLEDSCLSLWDWVITGNIPNESQHNQQPIKLF